MRFISALLIATAIYCADPPKCDLVLKDANGHKVRVRDLRGKVVVLNFWATWCGPCNAEMPMIAEFEKQYAGRGAVFIGASMDDAKTRDRVPDFVREHNISFPIWYGATADDLDELKLGTAVPATAFVDSEGRIVARIQGQARPEEIKERLEWLLGDRAGPPPAPLVKHLEK
jgi:thiol-disulfide isomerase/thioredoxin